METNKMKLEELEIIKNNRLLGDYLVSRSKMSIDKMGWYVDSETNVPYLNPPFDRSWDMLIRAWHIFSTEMWNSGVDISYAERDFNDCVSRNAPKTAAEILANRIAERSKSINLQEEEEEDETQYTEEEVIKALISFNQEISEVENVRDWFNRNIKRY